MVITIWNVDPVTGKINRKDFNLTWDAVKEAGRIVASN